MNKFYEDISSNECVHLLKATPYTKETRDRFDNNLTKDIFFKDIYTERSKKQEFAAENDLFDSKINHAARDVFNEFGKVSVIHIAGYGGCGKTTYIHHLLWSLHDEIGMYDVIDYEGCVGASEPFIERISKLIYKLNNIQELLDYFDKIASHTLYNINRFKDQIQVLEKFSHRIQSSIAEDFKSEKSYKTLLQQFEEDYILQSNNNSIVKKEFLSFLLFLEFALLLFSRFKRDDDTPMILVIDNVDSLSDMAEESLLLTAIREFENNCNYFFGWNIDNDGKYNGQIISDVLKKTKLSMFFTTRVATIKKYESIQPDWERIDGWVSIRFPKHYYDHMEIINHRIEYFLTTENEDSEIANELKTLKQIAEIAYHNYNFMRLFNGSYRVCVERICNILNSFQRSQIEELLMLYSLRYENPNAIEGANGYFLYMILGILKNEDTYTDTLNLSPCKKDGTISLSRIILTILREKGDRCSLYELFKLLTPLGYDENEICTQIWSLSEVSRIHAWRRLLIFDVIIPSDLEHLKKQITIFKNGEENIAKYSELVICTAGQAYMEFVIPHFEFMLSRRELGVGTSAQNKYQPLFAESSEENISKTPGKIVYRFEQKINWVFKAVEECCYNSTKFAEKVLDVFKLDRNDYINNTFYNYHSVGWERNVGPKQSYESRLIFRHIGYIEKYRCYLLTKRKEMPVSQKVCINKILVNWIVKYLELYNNYDLCYQTELQNLAEKELMSFAQKIIDSGYTDFDTRIERNN